MLPSDDRPSSSTPRLKWTSLMVEKVTRRDSRYLEDVSGDFDESVSEKEFSPPDNKQRPVSKEDITPARIPEVPYEQKEEAKRAGAWWAPKLKKWYV